MVNDEPTSRNAVDRSTVDTVVQAGVVHGGVHVAKRGLRWWHALVAVAAVGLVVGGAAFYGYWSREPDLTATAAYQPDVDLPAAVLGEDLGPQDFPNDKSCRSVVRWAVERGGAYASGTVVRLNLHNQGGTAVVNRIVVRVTERLAPPTGTAFGCDSSGSPDRVVVDLDEDSPIVRHQTRDGGAGAPYASDTVQELPHDATKTIDITPITTKCLCRWQIDVEYTSRGKPRTETVTGPDGDFATAATTGVAHSYSSIGTGWSGR
ncbi:hypothetical protein ABTZ99_35250 [Actinosynnema sp. NPDC002837]